MVGSQTPEPKPQVQTQFQAPKVEHEHCAATAYLAGKYLVDALYLLQLSLARIPHAEVSVKEEIRESWKGWAVFRAEQTAEALEEVTRYCLDGKHLRKVEEALNLVKEAAGLARAKPLEAYWKLDRVESILNSVAVDVEIEFLEYTASTPRWDYARGQN